MMSNNPRFIHRKVWQLALPMILSNISTPLLGLVDTAVMGHLETPQYLGGVAVGGLIFGFIFWGFGFLRMGTTGLTAQSLGNENYSETKAILVRALLIALFIATTLLILQTPIKYISFLLIDSSHEVTTLAKTYFNIRIWSSPATLCLYALNGWFLGIQNVKSPLLIVVSTNLCNIFLDVWFVVHLKMDIAGVALATVISEYAGLFIALLLLRKQLHKISSPLHWQHVFRITAIKNMLIINNNIFIRTWCLIFSFAFFTVQSSKLGDTILAANTVLLNFQMFMSYALDGFAHAVEALVGKAMGARDKLLLRQSIATAALWSCMVAIGFTLTYACFGANIIRLLSDLDSVIVEAMRYLPWLIFLPIASFVCFLFDGIFVGATLSKEMRNSMLFALFCCYLPTWYFTQEFHNHGLWLALTCFMISRSLSMGLIFARRHLI